MDQQELTELMQTTAQDAVLYAAHDHSIELNFSLDSLKLVDTILIQLYQVHKTKPHSNEMMFTLCNLFGAYIGEVFIKNVGGDWFYDESTADAPFTCVRFSGKEFPFASVVYNKIAVQPEVSVSNYVSLAINNAMQ